jgi:hypothetical protein
LPEGHSHELNTGEYVTFCEVQGMTELNGNKYKVIVKDRKKFSIECDTRNFKKYEAEGFATEIK